MLFRSKQPEVPVKEEPKYTGTYTKETKAILDDFNERGNKSDPSLAGVTNSSQLVDHITNTFGKDHFISKLVEQLRPLVGDMSVRVLDENEYYTRRMEHGIAEAEAKNPESRGSFIRSDTLGNEILLRKGKGDDTITAAHEIVHGGLKEAMDRGGKYADDLKKLAKLESREVLLAKVAGAANAALAKAAALFQAPLSKTARTIAALEAKGGANPTATPAPAAVAEVAEPEVSEVVVEEPAVAAEETHVY